MVLSANTLVTGSSYTFSLTAAYISDRRRLQENSFLSSSATVTILVNTPPTGGRLDVSPEEGEKQASMARARAPFEALYAEV